MSEDGELGRTNGEQKRVELVNMLKECMGGGVALFDGGGGLFLEDCEGSGVSVGRW